VKSASSAPISPLEQHAPQPLHALVGDARQGVLRNELGDAAHREQQQHGGRHDPQRELAAVEATVEQRLEKGGHQRLGNGRHQCPRSGRLPTTGESRQTKS
jgi:hypothetical protein